MVINSYRNYSVKKTSPLYYDSKQHLGKVLSLKRDSAYFRHCIAYLIDSAANLRHSVAGFTHSVAHKEVVFLKNLMIEINRRSLISFLLCYSGHSVRH